MTRTFSKEQLRDWGMPHEAPPGGEIVLDEIIYQSRWSIHHRLVFRLEGQPEDEAWQVEYSRGATEMQDEMPWEDDDVVEAELVKREERTVFVWE